MQQGHISSFEHSHTISASKFSHLHSGFSQSSFEHPIYFSFVVSASKEVDLIS